MKSPLVSTKEFVNKILKKLDSTCSTSNKKQKLSSATTATARTVQLVGYDDSNDDDDDLSITSQSTTTSSNNSCCCFIVTTTTTTTNKLPLIILKSCLKKTRTTIITTNNRSSLILLTPTSTYQIKLPSGQRRQQQDDNNKLHITRSRHISFYNLVQVHPIIPTLELLSDEIISSSSNNNEDKNEDEDEIFKQLLWFTQDEYDNIKRNNQNFIKDIKHGVLICNNKDQYSIRGLEHHLSSDNIAHKFMTIRHSVLDEQEKQRSHNIGGIYDEIQIANIYKTMNECNVKDAIQRGIIDHASGSNY